MMHDIATLIVQYGLLLVFANVLLEQIGLPVPAVPTMMVAGALAADGRLSAPLVFAAAFAASLIGDVAWYVAGRRYGNQVMSLLCRISLAPDTCVAQSELRFKRWGEGLLVVAKFVPGLSTVAPPLAGAMQVGWTPFLVFNGIGIVVWAGLAVGTGVLFHAQLDGLFTYIENVGAGAMVALAALAAAYIGLKWLQRRRLRHALRMARIGADELFRLMQAGEQPVVVDVRSADARSLDPRAIPGALLFDVLDIDRHLSHLRPEQDIILYCTCPDEVSAVRAAQLLIDRGFARVRPLAGGLDGWVAAGYEPQPLMPA